MAYIVRLPPKAPAVHSRIGSAAIPQEGDPYMFEKPRNYMQLWLLRGCRIHGLKEVLKVKLLRVRSVALVCDRHGKRNRLKRSIPAHVKKLQVELGLAFFFIRCFLGLSVSEESTKNLSL